MVGALRLPTLQKHYDDVDVVGTRTRHQPLLTHRLRRIVLFGFRAGGGQIR